MKRLFLFFLIFVLCASNSKIFAAKTGWIIEPKFTSILPYSDNMLKVRLNSKVGIYDYAGKSIVPVMADSITFLQNGYALVLEANDQEYQILGILHADKSYYRLENKYYLSDYTFFSENKLPVKKSVLKQIFYGYIDPTGKAITKFKYSEAHPFSEGLAAVSSASITSTLRLTHRKMQYINEQGIELKLDKELGNIYGATTFSNGEAMVTRKDKSTFFIDKNGQILRREEFDEISFDSMHRLIQDENFEEEDLEPDNNLMKKNKVTVVEDHGKVGLQGVLTNTPEPKKPVKKEDIGTGDIRIMFSSLSARANANHSASVNVILRNEYGKDITVKLTVEGATIKADDNIVVPANGRKSLPIRFGNIKSFETRNVTVTVTGQGISKTRTVKVNLEPDMSDL